VLLPTKSIDVHAEMEKATKSTDCDETYQLPDGKTINLAAERFRCPEVLFHPELIGEEAPGIHQLMVQSVGKCDIDLRRDLYQNVVLSGGTTMFPGIVERIQREVTDLIPASLKLRISAPKERKTSVWLGGSILASVPTFFL